MKRAWLHEAAKFGAGLVAADFFMFWWLSSQNFLPASFLGITITPGMVGPGMFVDVFLLLILIHYGWHVGKMPRIKERMYFIAAGVIFATISLVHFTRIITGSDFSILGWDAPVFLSWVGVIVSSYLAYASFHLSGRRK